MKKQKIFVILAIIVIIIITVVIISGIIFKEMRKQKAYEVFGDAYCEKYKEEDTSGADSGFSGGIAGAAITPWQCKICGKRGTYPNTNVPKICKMCSALTGRCRDCGKIIGNEN